MTAQSVADVVHHIRHSVGVAWLPELGVIQVEGPDAQAFLQNQTTNDVNAVASGQGQLTALLNRKAQLIALFSLHRCQTAFWLMMEKSLIPTVLEALERVHFMEDLTMTDASDTACVFSMQGPEARTVLNAHCQEPIADMQEHDTAGAVFQGVSVLVMKRSFTGEEGYCVIVPTPEKEAFQQALDDAGAPMIMTPEVMDTLRIEAGMPQYGVDMDSDTLLPATGLERVCVSYTKGCYPGQEVVAKVKTYGSVGKVLLGLLLEEDAPLPVLNTPCEVDGKAIGTLKSATYSPTLGKPIALAYLDRDHRVSGKAIQFVAGEYSYDAIITALPFYTPLSQVDKAQQVYEAALALFAEDKEREAADQLREAIELNPRHADAYEALGVILSRWGQYDEAIHLMQKLLEIDPDVVMAHTNLSLYYMKLGMKEAAEDEQAKATMLEMKKASEKVQAQHQSQDAQAEKHAQLTERIGMFEQVLALDAEDALANYGLGNTYVELEQYEQAITPLEKAIAVDSQYTVAYLALGKAYAKLNQGEKAKAIFTQGVDIASKRGDMMPLQEMQRYLMVL